MKVIVGLGNPGPAYEKTRHNIGFEVVRHLARRWKIGFKEETGLRVKVGEGSITGQRVRLVLPQTFMNASGEAVGSLAKRWRVKPEALLVVCDDFALRLGTVRLRGQGSDGGHQGLASILGELQTEGIARLRVGIATGRVEGNWTPFVLGGFTGSEQPGLEAGLDRGIQACESWLSDGLAAAMNRFNRRKVENE